jgi:hypothetical protein
MVERKRRRRDTTPQAPDGVRREGNMTDFSHDSARTARPSARVAPQTAGDGWIKPSHGKGMLKPWRKGETGYNGKPSRYIETQQLCRQHSLEAVQALIERLKDADGRIVVVAANSLLERAWGKVREQKPEEQQQMHIDLSRLNAAELKILVDLVQSGRLSGVPTDGPNTVPVIDAAVEPVSGK